MSAERSRQHFTASTLDFLRLSSRVAALSSDELYAALQSMQSGKAPGIDGLPVYFNKCFWSVVGRDLLSFLSDSLTAELQEGGPDLTA